MRHIGDGRHGFAAAQSTLVVTGGIHTVASPAIRYRLLGRVEIVIDGAGVPLSGRTQRQLLAVLLLRRGCPVPASRLAELLWGDQPPVDPSAALRSQVARLRRALGRHREDLVSLPGGYAMVVDASACDAARFTELVARSRSLPPSHALRVLDEALGLWEGPALVELAGFGAFTTDALHLDELRLEAEERRADQLLVLRREDQAVAALVRLLTAAPERERARGLLMEALYRTGRHTEALATYEAWRHQLAEERGLEPSPELRRLEADILNHRLASRPLRTPPERVAAASSPLAVPASTFVGRDAELVMVARTLTGSRLVTLTGPGGVGKTRLAVEVTRSVNTGYVDGVFWCDLSGVGRSAEVPPAVADAAGLRNWTADRIEEQLIQHLRRRRCLLVLDNCEHVLDGAASIADRLVRMAEDVAVLATSRERLLVEGEQVIAVSPLAVDGEGSPAVVLFIDRARAAGAEQLLEDMPTGLVAEVCRRLDGVPLAIELAAGRAPCLSLSELASALDHRFDFLDLGPRCHARHRSLRVVVDWSYDQLSPPERHAFERLCVFNAPFTLADAEVMLESSGVPRAHVARLVTDLVQHALVVRSGDHTASRYSVLETLRAYGLERLAERDQNGRVESEHAAWVLWLAGGAAGGLAGPDERWWVERLDGHIDDLRMAHRWLADHDPDGVLRLLDALHPYAFWRTRSEVFSWMEATVAARAPSSASCRLLASVCAGAWQRGDLSAAQTALAAAVDAGNGEGHSLDRRVLEQTAELALLGGRTDTSAQLFKESAERAGRDGDLLQQVWDLGSAALALAYGGRQAEAEACAKVAIRHADGAGSPSARAFARFAAGEVLSSRSPSAATPLLRSAIQLARSVDNVMVAGLAQVAMASVVASSDTAGALRQYEHAVQTWQRSSCWTAQWVTLRNLADLLARSGRPQEAAVLRGAVLASRGGAPAFGRDEQLLDELGRRLEVILGPDELASVTHASCALSDDDVVALALDTIRDVLSAR